MIHIHFPKELQVMVCVTVVIRRKRISMMCSSITESYRCISHIYIHIFSGKYDIKYLSYVFDKLLKTFLYKKCSLRFEYFHILNEAKYIQNIFCSLQEQAAQEMLGLTRALKENFIAAGHTIRDDTKVKYFVSAHGILEKQF